MLGFDAPTGGTGENFFRFLRFGNPAIAVVTFAVFVTLDVFLRKPTEALSFNFALVKSFYFPVCAPNAVALFITEKTAGVFVVRIDDERRLRASKRFITAFFGGVSLC